MAELHLEETRDRLTVYERIALDDAVEAVLYEIEVGHESPAAGDDRLAIVEQTIAEYIIASRRTPRFDAEPSSAPGSSVSESRSAE